MKATATVKDQGSVQFELNDTETINSISDFNTIKLKESEDFYCNQKEDFLNTFICHLIFYAVFCISIVVHIFLDLGLGSFIKNKLIQLISIARRIGSNNIPDFAN